MLDQNIQVRPNAPSIKRLRFIRSLTYLTVFGLGLGLGAEAFCASWSRRFGLSSLLTYPATYFMIAGFAIVVVSAFAPVYARKMLEYWHTDLPSGKVIRIYRRYVDEYHYVYAADAQGTNRAGETITNSYMFKYNDWLNLKLDREVDIVDWKRL